MDLRGREPNGAGADPRDAEILRLRREVAALRGREGTARSEVFDARRHFSDLTEASRRFASSMRAGVRERQQYRRRIAAQYAVSQVLASARDLDEAAPKLYEILGERLNWHAGVLWKLDEGTGVLRRAGHWRSSGSSAGALEAANEDATFRRGQGLPGRVWDRGEPVWVEDILEDGDTTRAEAAAEDGLRGALAFPIADGAFVGVFELFRREKLPPDEDLIRTAGLVGGQIAQFLERRRAEEALARNEARWRSLIDKGADVLTISERDGTIRFASPSVERVCGYGVEEFVGMSPFEAGHIHPDDLERCADAFRELSDDPGGSVTIQHRYRHKSQGWRWLEGTFTNLFDDASVGGLVANFRDITERKEAEEAMRGSEARQAFLVRLGDALRPLDDPVEVQATASRVLGEHLGADRAYYVEIDEAAGEFVVARDYRRPGAPSHARRYPLEDWPMPWLADGQTWVVRDVDEDPAMPDQQRAWYRGIGAAVVAPLVKEGRLAAALVADRTTPRPWTPQEVALVEETAERTWAAVERARAEKALRETEERHRAELERQVRERTAELKESRDLIQATMDASMDMIQVFEAVRDESGEIVDFEWLLNNHTSEKEYGEVVGQSLLERNPGVVEEGIFEAFKEVVETGVPQQDERRCVHEQFDGWFLQSAVKLGDGVATTTKEITEWKRAQEEVLRLQEEVAEAKLRESEDRYRHLIDFIPAAVYACNADATLAYHNSRAVELWGREPEADDKAWMLCGSRRTYGPDGTPLTPEESPTAGVLATGEPAVDRELKIERPDGTIIDILANVTALRDGAGNITGAVNIFQDITDRKRAEAALRQNAERQAFLVKLGDALRSLSDPAELQGEACRLLAENLGVDRAYYVEVDEASGVARVVRDFARGGSPSLAGEHPVAALSWSIEILRRGECHVIDDAQASPLVPPADRPASAALGITACMGAPLVKDGVLVGALCVADAETREWSESEVDLLRETGERIWTRLERARAEEASRESEERLSAIFSGAEVGLCELSLDGRFVMVNDGLCRILGRSREELLESSVADVTYSADVAESQTALEELLTGGEPVSLDKRYERPDGTLVWANSTTSRLDDEEGRPRGILVVTADLTDRRLAEEALRESEHRLQQTIAIETVGVVYFDDTRTIVDSNDAFLRMSGYGREEVEEKVLRWDDLTPPEHMPRTLEAERELVSFGRSTPFEKEYLREDGTRRWGLFAGTRLYEGEYVAFVTDITEAKRAEEALRSSEERFRAVAELVPDLLWSNDATGNTGWYNRRWFEYTGQNVGEAEAYGWLYTVHPEDREDSLQGFLRAVDSGLPFRSEHRIRGRDGSYRWFLVRANPLRDDEGRAVRWFGAATDVHEQRTALEALTESEERYRSLAEATSSIVWTGDSRGEIVEPIPAWEEYTGQTYREYRGFGWLDALHPENRPPEGLWEEISASNPEPMEAEYRLRHRDGEYRRVVLRGVPIVEGGGETREWVGTIFDVENNRRAEEEREELRRLAEEERTRLETILKQMPGGVFIAEPSGRFVLANEGARRIYGDEIGSVEECGRGALSYPDGGKMPREEWPLVRALGGDSVSGVEYLVVRPDGTRRVVRTNAAPARDDRGRVVAAVKVFEDVTSRKEAEAELDRSRERELRAREQAEEAERRLAFYAGAREERHIISRELHDRVAHSIAAVRQNLELYEVLRERSPEAAAAKLELAKDEAKASLKSTRDLSMMLRRSEVEEGMVRAIANLEETTVPMGVRYESSVKGDESLVPPHIGNQIFLVLREAIRNAVNHSGCERVAVDLEITKERVIGTVEDDGRGFEPDGTRANGGLRSMRERASLVGGTFELNSVPGGGAKVEISVPLAREGS
ncbi:PAS domain S-box protein [Rubrobacter marinus]|uniref:histidine kinase n=1 Tax=Rubrobacter marinus TaxID=2653852 RepID=A0A6G8PTT4_9ACTN|nr:PAS domain S-box protein [Rubrobacter marinus]QIN77909.1 PAS domain S-box protein [Rubrobacter marinus]